MGVLSLVAKRLALGFATLLVVSIIIFGAVELLPGDPRPANPRSVRHAGDGQGDARGTRSGPPGSGALLRLVDRRAPGRLRKLARQQALGRGPARAAFHQHAVPRRDGGSTLRADLDHIGRAGGALPRLGLRSDCQRRGAHLHFVARVLRRLHPHPVPLGAEPLVSHRYRA